MTVIKNQAFEGVVVNFDGYQYKNCTFTRCQFVFTGMSLPNLLECQMTDCGWAFVGPAQNAFNFLNTLYNSNPAGKVFVEQVFQSIRNGLPPQHVVATQQGLKPGPVN